MIHDTRCTRIESSQKMSNAIWHCFAQPNDSLLVGAMNDNKKYKHRIDRGFICLHRTKYKITNQLDLYSTFLLLLLVRLWGLCWLSPYPILQPFLHPPNSCIMILLHWSFNQIPVDQPWKEKENIIDVGIFHAESNKRINILNTNPTSWQRRYHRNAHL